MTPRELGPYLLLRKLSEDSLSEIYRAGQKSGDDVERVVLLCFFKARQEDAAWLAETATVGRRALKGLSSPCLADVVDSGEAAGSAYLAYEYISGVGLREIMEQARREGSPVPLEVALHVVDRVATALIAAWEHESRMLHGFAVPHLVMVSNEGEVHLLGIEVASRLRRLLTDERLESEVRSYLAPEVVPQSQAATTDDVYSLGALLFALITGSALPADEGSPAAAIERATLAGGGEVPGAVRQLLVTSLAAAPNRARLADWYESLHEMVLSDEYDATSFKLAVYLHRLFGDELERAAESMPEESPTPPSPAEIPPSTPTPSEIASEPEIDFDVPEIEPVAADDELLARAEEERLSRRPLLVAAAVVALLAAGGAALYFGLGSGSDGSTEIDQMASQSAESADMPESLEGGEGAVQPGGEASTDAVPSGTQVSEEGAAPTTPPPSPAQPTKEELDRRVADLVAKQSKQIEGTLRGEYEEEIETLRKQLADLAAAQSEPAATEPQRTGGSATGKQQPETAARPSTSPGTPAAAVTTSGPSKAGDAVAAEPTGQQPEAPSPPTAGQMETPPDSATVEASTATETAGSSTGSGVTMPTPKQTESSTTRKAEPMSPEPSGAATQKATSAERSATGTAPASGNGSSDTEETAPAGSQESPVRYGQLVENGPGVSPPQLEQSVDPIYPMVARRLGRTAVVNLRLLIDENGEVAEVERMGEKAGFGFDEAAITAARRMKWKAATKNGVRVKIWWPVRIAFQP